MQCCNFLTSLQAKLSKDPAPRMVARPQSCCRVWSSGVPWGLCLWGARLLARLPALLGSAGMPAGRIA